MRTHWFFDFDGTLCDTEEDIKSAWRAAIRGLGRSCPQFDQIYRTGPTLDQVARQLFADCTPELVARIRELFRTAYDESDFPNTHPYPWAMDWLKALKAQGCRIYVATNKRWRPLAALMRKLGWESWLDGYYAFDMYAPVIYTKAELLARVMTDRHIAPEDAVMVGDTKGDVDAGRAAGLYTIGCTWGYGTRAELEGADECRDA